VKTKWKVIITLAVVLVAAVGLYASTVYSKRGVVTVQTGQVTRGDLAAIVTSSGEIKPKNYINIGANAMGNITEILVKEGDHVRKGQLLARVENTQPTADVAAYQASVSSAEADTTASEAGLKAADENIHTMEAGLEHDKADLDRMKADYDRAQELFNEKLLARQDFELKKFTYEAQKAQITNPQPASCKPERSASRTRRSFLPPSGTSRRRAPTSIASRMCCASTTPCAARWRGHQPARARRRIGGARHPEFRGQQ
jgi:HlyD family secretion protein